ncbi:hypothetical protein OTU49_000884, partial [Cherax quadricarinatus]
RVHMGCLQLKRWLSFLPAAFVVYILLHYLVYQPDLTGPHPAVLVGSGRSNESVVSLAGVRTLQSGPRILPPLPQDASEPQAVVASETDATTVINSPTTSVVSGHHIDNTTVIQGSGSSDAVSHIRFDSMSQALGEDTSGALVEEDLGVLGDGSLVGAGGVEATNLGSGSTRGFEASVAVPAALEAVSSASLAFPDPPTALLRRSPASTSRPAPHALPGTSVIPHRTGIPRGPVRLPPPIPVSGAKSEGASYPYRHSNTRYDRRNLVYTYQGRDAYAHPPYGPPYDPYSAAFSRENAAQRALYTHSHAMAKMGGLSPSQNDLSPVYDSFAYPDGRDLTMGEEVPPPGRPDVVGHSGVVSTVRVTSTALTEPQKQSQLNTVTASSAQPPKPPLAKKTPVIRKSAVAVSSTLAINALKGKIKVGEKYESGFSVPHEELCENNGRELKVLVLITTAPDHEKHRTAVRQTWGHFSLRKDVVMAFVIGRTTNFNVQSNIDKENELFGDIIQANFIDHYSNLTLKTVSMFEWIKTYCSESHFVLKTDDDMFINMPLLLSFIESKANEDHVMYGRMAKGWKPVRNKKSKYFIDTKTYSKSKYPDFLTGPAYLFTSDVVDDIYQKALDTTFFVLEDVLLTGIVGESLRIRRIGDSRFRNEKIKLTDTCGLLKTISIHMVKYEEQFDIYKRTLDGKAKCKTG